MDQWMVGLDSTSWLLDPLVEFLHVVFFPADMNGALGHFCDVPFRGPDV